MGVRVPQNQRHVRPVNFPLLGVIIRCSNTLSTELVVKESAHYGSLPAKWRSDEGQLYVQNGGLKPCPEVRLQGMDGGKSGVGLNKMGKLKNMSIALP